MSARPQTVQIYLPGGDPRGIRVAELTTRIVQVLEVPRALLAEFLKMLESKQVAALAITGRTANGWHEWKNAAGKTLHELKRSADGTEPT